MIISANSKKIPLKDETVDCVVTSPPYFGLRTYGGVESEIGREKMLHEYIESILLVFREVKRVLKQSGTLWLNLGDTYASSLDDNKMRGNMYGVPWRIAFCLQAEGWILRSDVIWHKPNCLPESVRNRPVKSHEYLFMFVKSNKYYYDYDASLEPAIAPWNPATLGKPTERKMKLMQMGIRTSGGNENGHKDEWRNMRAKRTVWSIPYTNNKHAAWHLAKFPLELAETCISISCPIGGLVLDPFIGSGTTAVAARRLGRKCIGLDISFDYCASALRRIPPQLAFI